MREETVVNYRSRAELIFVSQNSGGSHLRHECFTKIPHFFMSAEVAVPRTPPAAVPSPAGMSKVAAYSPIIENQIKLLREDDIFQSYIHTPLIQEAVKHWLNIKRLPSDLAEEKFSNNYMVQSVFDRIKNLQQACAQEHVQFPLDLILLDKPASPSPVASTTTTTTTPVRAGVLKQPSTHTRKREARGESASIRFDQNIVREFRIKGDEANSKRYNKTSTDRLSLSVTDPKNIAKWWALQCILIAISLVVYMLYN